MWFAAVTFNNIPLTLGTDYNIVKGHLYIYSALGPGTLETKYLAVGNFGGYTPGNLPWETVFEGAGMYYATGFTPGTGGSLTLQRNPYYWMETPPLGEVDFARKPNGACKVDIFDLVLAAGAYGSQGTAVPSAKWFAGADVAPPAGKIDIFDMVTIASQYGQEYDFPE